MSKQVITAKRIFHCMPEVQPDRFEDWIIRELTQNIVERLISDKMVSFESVQDFTGVEYKAYVTCYSNDGLHGFSWAYEQMMNGKCVRRKDWTGYWYMRDKELYIQCKDGSLLNLRESDDMPYTLSNIAADDWVLAEERDQVKHDAG